MSKERRPFPLRIDENIPERTTQALRDLGHDVRTLRRTARPESGTRTNRCFDTQRL